MNLDEFHEYLNKSITKHSADGSYLPKGWDFFPVVGPIDYFSRQVANNPKTVTSGAVTVLGTLGLAAVNAGYAAVLGKLLGVY